MRFISVDLPEPEGPMMATYSLWRMRRLMPRRALTCWSPISYVFQRLSVTMTSPSVGAIRVGAECDHASRAIRFPMVGDQWTSGAPAMRSGATLASRLWSVGDGSGGVIALDEGAALEGAQDLVAASDDLIARLEAGEDFDVGGPGDSGGDGDEGGAQFAMAGEEQVDSLGEIGLGSAGGSEAADGGGGFAVRGRRERFSAAGSRCTRA